MEFIDFLRKMDRVCENSDHCQNCPLKPFPCNDDIASIARNVDDQTLREMEDVVKEWNEKHPAKTRKSEFLKMFPNAQMVDIERIFCVAHFDVTKKCKGINPSEEQCIACRYRFWNEEMADND